MSTITSSAIATVQARRFSARSQANMRKRGGSHGIHFSGGRTSLYKQIYNNGAKNGVNKQNLSIYAIGMCVFLL